MLIVLGSTGGMTSGHDPLDYKTRKAMIKKEYPKIRVANLYDCRFDETWSGHLDELIYREFPGRSAILYGSRESCLPHYHGRHKTEWLKSPYPKISATNERNSAKLPLASKDFRLGMIYAAQERFPISYQTVDVAIIDYERQMILLGARNSESGLLRFVGGFVDPKDKTLELAAKREAYEETSGLEIDDLAYIGSFRIEDTRYRASDDGIMTAFFAARYIFGAPRAGDDMDRLEWVPWDVFVERLIDEHRPLGKKLQHYLGIAEERN